MVSLPKTQLESNSNQVSDTKGHILGFLACLWRKKSSKLLFLFLFEALVTLLLHFCERIR